METKVKMWYLHVACDEVANNKDYASFCTFGGLGYTQLCYNLSVCGKTCSVYQLLSKRQVRVYTDAARLIPGFNVV